MGSLYPLKFLPLYKEVLWGGNRLRDMGFDYAPLPNCGEMWVLSSVEGKESVVENGFLAENTLNELIEVYMGDLVGEKVYNRFGNDFPLLFKVIDAAQDLSVQVHPNDELAQRRGMPWGKTEMWYVMAADKGARLISGFSHDTSREDYVKAVESGQIEQLLHVEQPSVGDVYFIPSGRVHALGRGLMVAEIQQTSDCTYRIYDYNRVDKDGHQRELHTSQALDAIDFSRVERANVKYDAQPNRSTTVVACDQFLTKVLHLTQPVRKNLEQTDSFVVYFCVEGVVAVKALDMVVPIRKGECVLVPAVADEVELHCDGDARLLEVSIDTSDWHDADNTERDWIAQFVGSE